MNIEKFSIVKRAKRHGCKAETPQGIARWWRKNRLFAHPESLVFQKINRTGFGPIRRSEAHYKPLEFRRIMARVAIVDGALSDEVKQVVHGANGRVKNWSFGLAVTDSDRHGKKETESLGNYSSRCTFTKYLHHHVYHSELRVYRSGRTVELWQAGKMARRVFAPSGLRFDRDTLGVKVVAKDGVDFHPDIIGWKSPKFATEIRAALAIKRESLAAQAKVERENKRHSKIMESGLSSCVVTLDDSRRAGNCVEGSLRFAESRLGLNREEILACRHLTGVLGRRLLATRDERARKAVVAAWSRETIVSI